MTLIKTLLTIYYSTKRLLRREYPLAILYYHHVLKEPNIFFPADICETEFNKQIEYLKKIYNILPLSKAIKELKNGTLKRNSLVITFDDGYKDNYDYAIPILVKHNVHATVFIATEGIESGILWNNAIEQSIIKTKNTSIPKGIIGEKIDISSNSLKIKAIKLLTSVLKRMSNKERTQKVKQLSNQLNAATFDRVTMNAKEISHLVEQGFEIGAHTHSHTILSAENINDCKEEIEVCKAILEKITEQKTKYFAYPNGSFGVDFNSQHRTLINELGFEAAFSTNDGGCFKDSNLFSLSRFMTIKKILPLFALSIAKIAHEQSKSDETNLMKL